MSRSLMLKNEAGRAVGYVLVRDGCLIARVTGADGQAALAVKDEEGRRSAYPIDGDGLEWEAPYAGQEVIAAYVSQGDSLIALANDESRALFLSREVFCGAETAPQKMENPPEFSSKEADSSVYTHKENDAPGEAGALWPERRWPPPVCWPQARYRDGRWTQEEGG